MIEKEQRPAHWRETFALMSAVIGALVGGTVLLVLFAVPLDAFTPLGFPIGFYALAQGALIVCVIAAFWFANRQERIDRRHGAMEDV
jgi:putative solute:sodium symporter small subunit